MIVGAVIAAVLLHYDVDKLTITGTITIYFIFDRYQCNYSDSRCCNCCCSYCTMMLTNSHLLELLLYILSLTGANAIIVIVGVVIAAVLLHYDVVKLTITGTITIYFIFDRCQCYYSDSRCCDCCCSAAL